jgi:hypothetical protein
MKYKKEKMKIIHPAHMHMLFSFQHQPIFPIPFREAFLFPPRDLVWIRRGDVVVLVKGWWRIL